MLTSTIGSGSAPALHRRHVLLAAEALGAVVDGKEPADATLRALFARHRNAGARDRARIAELLYGVLRNYFPLRALLGSTATPLDLCAAQALRSGAALPSLRELDAAALAAPIAGFDETRLDAAARHNLPPWLWDALCAQHGPAEAARLARALNEPATVDLRVNTLKATREAAQAALRADGIESEPTPHAPAGLRLARREPLQRSRAFREGLVEPQDEGSQRLAEFVAPTPGERVADFCAGAGGKTLALGALMHNEGELHAFDASAARLARLTPRLARSALTIVTTHVLRAAADPDLRALAGRFDKVLVDAPCSGTGTLRRNPELRLRSPDLAALPAQQLAILDAAATLVRGGGALVYATCSVLADENERVVERFIAQHPEFRAAGAPLVLLPHRDGTDGFYAARIARAG
jgi:16S rRNA (cytosine967-C5)-methyltransferase